MFEGGEVLGMLLKVRPRIVSGYCQHLVRWSQWSLLRCLVDQNRLSRMGPMISCLVRSLMWHATESVLPYWYGSSRSIWTLWWMWYWIWRKWTGKRFLKLWDEQEWDKRRGPRWLSELKREFIEVGAYDELTGGVVNLPGKSEYLSCLPDNYGSRRRTLTRYWMW